MSGRREFETVVASAPREKLVRFETVTTTPLAYAGVETKYFYAPINTVVELKGLLVKLDKPIGGTSGYHDVYCAYNNPIIDIMSGGSTFAAGVQFNNSYWIEADNFKRPPSDAAQIAVMQGITFDDTTPFLVTYSNAVNATQTGSRIIRLWGVQKELS